MAKKEDPFSATIPAAELDELIRAWYFRQALKSTGVELWMGYDTAIELMDEMMEENIYGR